jgi:hypothetical protein
MRFIAGSVLVLGVILALPAAAPGQQKGKVPSRQVFVSVVDRTGAPVATLQPSDFEVTEAGLKREVLSASLASSPMRVIVLVDTGDGLAPALNHLRAGLVAFAEGIGPQHELMLVGTGRQVRVRVPPTTDHQKFIDTAKGLFGDGGATILSDALMEMDDRFIKKAENRWPVFVIVTGDGSEASAAANEKKFNEWLQALPARGIGAHAIVIKYRGGGMPELVANHVAQTAGGHYDFMNTSNSLPEKLKAIAELMTKDFERASVKYEVVFASNAPAGTPVAVGIARGGITFDTTATRLR